MSRNIYAEAGVDFEKEHDAVKIFTKLFEQTRGNIDDLKELGFELPGDVGYFADGISIDVGALANALGIDAKVKLLKATDGAGTKPLAHQLYRMTGGKRPEALVSVGVDAVAMVVNDMLCAGARTVLLTDYVAWTEPDADIARDLASGLLIASNIAQCVVIGGENASLSEMIKGVPHYNDGYVFFNGAGISFSPRSAPNKPAYEVLKDMLNFKITPGKGYDICADAFGIIFDSSAAERLAGKDIEKGDIVIGVRSSGIHCNGISLARKKLVNYSPMGWSGEFEPEAKVDEFNGKSALEEILTPTEIYCSLLPFIQENEYVRAVINITGEGVRNMHRALGERYGADLDFSSVKEPHAIFPMLQKLGNVSTREMYEDFNMGWGLYIIVDKDKDNEATKAISEQGYECGCIGQITNRGGRIRIKAFNGEEEKYEK